MSVKLDLAPFRWEIVPHAAGALIEVRLGALEKGREVDIMRPCENTS